MFDNISLTAVFTGLSANIVLSLVLGLIYGFIDAAMYGVPENFDVMSVESYMTTTKYLFSLVIGLFCVFIGGYVVAKIAKENIKQNTILMGMLGVVISLISVIVTSYPVWYSAISLITIIPAAYLGGLAWQKRNKV